MIIVPANWLEDCPCADCLPPSVILSEAIALSHGSRCAALADPDTRFLPRHTQGILPAQRPTNPTRLRYPNRGMKPRSPTLTASAPSSAVRRLA